MPGRGLRPKPSVPAAPPEADADFSPLLAERHVALAVSGGSDSTALMQLAAAWAQRNHSSLRLTVLTVDHGLRPEAAGEAREVEAWAKALGLPHHTLHWSPNPKPASAIQAKAREARYRLMTAWCRANGAGMLLTAHTLDDQAETVLMRLNRTFSPESLAGIAAQGHWEGFPLFRPLLTAKRAALRQYLSAIGQGWIDDPSNDDPRFERVRIRQSLASLGADGVTPERLAALAEAAARTAALLERTAARWLSMWLQEEEAGICHVPTAPFLGLPLALKERLLARIIHHYGGGQFWPEPEELRRLAVWVEQGGAPRCTLGGALVGRRKRGFWVTREAGRIANGHVELPESGEILWDNRFLVRAVPGSRITPSGSRKEALNGRVPVFARRAQPWVEQPPGTEAPAQIAFLRLLPS